MHKLIKPAAILATALFVIGLGFAGFIYFFPGEATELLREKEIVENPSAETCRECHGPIYDAWKKSRHATAWESKTFIAASDDRKKQKCYPCHIPKAPVYPDAGVSPGMTNRPAPRGDAEHLSDGIYCAACHLDPETESMRGPYDVDSVPHRSRKSDKLRVSDYCGACHEKTLAEWKTAGVKDTCGDCHMPRTKMNLVKKFPLDLLHPAKDVGDHSTPALEFGKGNIVVSAEVAPGPVLAVTVTNAKVPHRFPTADNGDPRAYLEISFFGSSDTAALETALETFAPQTDTAILFNETRRFEYKVPAGAVRASARLLRRPGWEPELRTELQKIDIVVPAEYNGLVLSESADTTKTAPAGGADAIHPGVGW